MPGMVSLNSKLFNARSNSPFEKCSAPECSHINQHELVNQTFSQIMNNQTFSSIDKLIRYINFFSFVVGLSSKTKVLIALDLVLFLLRLRHVEGSQRIEYLNTIAFSRMEEFISGRRRGLANDKLELINFPYVKK